MPQHKRLITRGYRLARGLRCLDEGTVAPAAGLHPCSPRKGACHVKAIFRVAIGLFSAGLSSGTALAQNAKKDSQSDARTKKCATLTGTERTTCLEQARKQPDPNGSTGDNQGAKTDNTASPQQVQPAQPGAQGGPNKNEPATGNAGQGQQRQQ